MPSIKFFQTQDQTGNEGMSIKHIILSVFIGLVLSMALLLVSALLMLYSGMSVQFAPVIAKIILFTGAFTSGIFSGYRRRSSGWLYGALAGLCYVFILIAVGIIFSTFNTLSVNTASSVLICLLTGVLGGILGINIKSSAKKGKKH